MSAITINAPYASAFSGVIFGCGCIRKYIKSAVVNYKIKLDIQMIRKCKDIPVKETESSKTTHVYRSISQMLLIY